jgi:hypothetical protein
MDPRVYTDETRPAGWYVNPQSPGQMRYWGSDGGWSGAHRTPRTLRKQWQEHSKLKDEV